MRFLKIAFAGLVTLLAMFASLIVAIGVALIGAIVFLYLRLRGRTAAMVFRRGAPRPAARPAAADVIEVTATEVSSTEAGNRRLER
jgi:hypothetical protein